MLRTEEPYFMTNPEWYEIVDDVNGVFKLTDKAPEMAKVSFDEFLKEQEEDELNKIEDLDDNEEQSAMDIFGVK